MNRTTIKYQFFLFFIACQFAAVTQTFAQTIEVTEVPDGCGFLRASFEYTGGTVKTANWNFGNGNNSTEAAPSAFFSAPGNYTVTVAGTLQDDTPFSDNVVVTVKEPPLAIIDIDGYTSGSCVQAPLTVQFDGSGSVDASANTITSYLWKLGDGTVSNEPTLSHTYESPGSYTVELTVFDDQGCSNTAVISQDIVLSEGFNLDFTATGDLQTCVYPTDIQFEATHDAGNYEYSWDFGDEDDSDADLQNPSHTYTEPGIYNVSLTVTDLDAGCSSTITSTALVQIQDFAGEIQRTGDEQGCAPFTTSFENISNIISANQIITWEFGDGTQLSGTATADSLRAPEHTYTQPGVYTIRATILDSETNCGGEAILVQAVTVPESPDVDFTADATGFCVDNFTVNFTNTTTNGATWEWDFGDGTTSTEQNPSHNYTDFGTYTVRLTATSADGCTSELIKESYIVAMQTVAMFEAYEAGGCAPDFTTTLIDSTISAVEITDYEWTITNSRTGDVVDTYTGEAPFISLQDTGAYDVTLSVSTAEGCTSEFTREAFLQVGVSAEDLGFTPSAVLVCNGEEIIFTNTTPVDADNPYEITWGWNYLSGDTLMSSEMDGAYTYDGVDPGVYTVSLYYLSNGCTDTITSEITVNPPKADFEYYTETCVFDSLFLVDASIGADRFEWEITVDGNTTTITDEENPVLNVPPGSEWSVTLTVENDDANCTHSVTQSGTQPVLGVPDFTGITVTPNTDGICYPAFFDFDASGVTIDGASITSYYWDFGNGQTSTSTSPNNVYYDEPGYYSVNLIITSDQGCKFDTLMVDVVKVYGPEINFEVCNAGTCKDYEVTFRDMSSSIADIVLWEWDFDGDGVIDSNEEYPEPWVYEVINDPQYNFYWAKLTVTDEFGCTASDSVKVRPTKPIADYDIIQQPDCGGDLVGFINVDSLSIGVQPFNGQWTFSDGQTAGGLEPVLFFEGNTAGIDYTGELVLYDINGCADTVDISFTVVTDSLIANFDSDYSGQPECPPYTVTFEDLSEVLNPVFIQDSLGNSVPNAVGDWYWDFGDGSAMSGVQNPVYTYTEPGVYDVTLIVQDSLGCLDTLVVEDYIEISGPEGEFTVSDTIGYPDLAVEFEGFPDNTDHILTWDFGNGEFREDENPTVYTYTEPGTYLSGLILLDDGTGCQDLVGTQRIEVLPCPVVRDTVFDYCVSLGDLILDSYDPTHDLQLGTMNYEWSEVDINNNFISSLGDSAAITIVPPEAVNTNQTPETHYYQLTVAVTDLEHNYTTGGANPSTKCEQTVVYQVTFLPAPEAEFVYTLTCVDIENVANGNTITVGLEDISELHGTSTTERRWDFNDDGEYNDTPEENSGLGAINSFEVSAPGEYPISLAILVDNGCPDTIRTTVFVPGVDFGVDNACSGQLVQFSDSTIYDPNFGTPIYAWDFENDGTVDSDEANPEFTYNTPGTYTVALTVMVPINSGFCPVTVTKEVEILQSPDASFLVESACLGTTTTFEASANPNIISYAWDFNGDGSIDTVAFNNTLERTYTEHGSQTMRLIVTSTDSCTAEFTETFDINPNPVADFIPNTCSVQGVTFTDLSTIDDSEVATEIFLREIDLGQGFRVVNDLNVFFALINEPGTYPITYRVTSDLGCTDDTTKIITIPEADFAVEEVCFGEETNFLDQSTTFGSPVILYEWDFDGDGITDAQGSSASFAYPSAGTFEATLTITNTSGCTATVTKTFDVKTAPEIIEVSEDKFICAGGAAELSVSYTSSSSVIGVEWDNGGGIGETVVVSPTETTLYTVTVTDSTGCTDEEYVLVNVVNTPYLPADTVICVGESYTIDATVPGGVPATYQWSTGSIDPIIEVTESGTYIVNVQAFGFDAENTLCEITDTVVVQFNTSPLPYSGDVTTCFAEGNILDLTLPNNFTNVVWTSDIFEAPIQANEIQVSEAGVIYLSATNELGCELYDSLTIEEVCEPLVFLPDAYTPNGDGLNDGFGVKGKNFTNYELTIYNRWGEMVFQTKDPTRTWMGNFNGEPMPAGLYPYVVKYESELTPGEQVVKFGNVNLIR
ncbi:PKD domain-containing protein [Chondrinema litorale]|uniref:PKD domain-containing protein n=1 Tax=Chondrinema litorale TaxID=2994555 RepID=UPI00254327E9|nr:PKD domain-containing protein [Chondrinema litorale]